MRDSSQETLRFRELVHEPSYTEALERIFLDVQWADDIMEGLESFSTWLSKRILEGRVRVLYAYTEEAVYLLNAWVIPAHLDGQFF